MVRVVAVKAVVRVAVARVVGLVDMVGVEKGAAMALVDPVVAGLAELLAVLAVAE
jgi:hypothetical protein